MRFLIDAQLPPALARMLTARGHVAEHVVDIGPADAPDRELWQYAIEHDAAIVTKDEDFPDMSVLDAQAPVIIWLRVGNTRRGTLLAWFESHLDGILATAEAGDRLIELR